MTFLSNWWPRGGLWRHGDFMMLWSAQAVSAFGSRISRTALPLAALLTIGAEPWQIGLLGALAVAPGVVVGLLMGGVIDRRAKRPMLIGCDLVRAALLLTVPAAAWFDLLTMPQLYVVAAGVGAATTLFQVADNTYLPALVGRRHLTAANARLEATDAVAEIGGPSLSGILVELLTAPFAILADALSYLVSAAFLFRIQARESLERVARQRGAVIADLKAGFGACLGEPVVRTLFVVAALDAFFGGFYYSGLYAVFVIEELLLGPATYGLLVALGGVGALLGALIAQGAARRLRLGPAMVVLLAGGKVAAIAMPLAWDDGWVSLLLLAWHQFASDALIVAFLIHAMSLRQAMLPLEVLGRANAAFHVTAGLLMPAGAAVAGVLASVFGIHAVMWAGVAGGLAVPVMLFRSPVRHLDAMPASNA